MRAVFATSLFPSLISLLLVSTMVWAQDHSEWPDLVGSWEGKLTIAQDSMNLAFTFSRTDSELTATLHSAAMGIYGMPAQTVEFDGRRLRLSYPRLDAEFLAYLRFDESGQFLVRLDGDWFQSSEMVPVRLLPVAAPSVD